MMRCTRWALVVLFLFGLASPVVAQSPSKIQPTSSTDGAHVTTGARADASSTDHTSSNSLMSFLKGLVRIWNDVWDDGNNRLNVAVQNSPTVNAGSGTFTNQQSNVTGDFDTGGGTQSITLFGISLPASGGAVIGGTSTNPLNVVFPSAQAVTQSGTWNIGSVTTLPSIALNQTGTANDVDATIANFPITATTNAISIRCVNTTGNAFEACGGGAGGGGGVSALDKEGFVAGTSPGTPAMGARDDASPSACAEDEKCIQRMTQARAGHVNLRNDAGTEVGTSGAPIRIDPTGTTTQPVSLASQPLPTGAATETTLSSMLIALQLIDNIVSGSGVNVSQLNGVTPLMGAGNTGTGSPRTTEASDSQLSAGVGATGDAAATAGSTGSVNAKLRLLTTLLDNLSSSTIAEDAPSTDGERLNKMGCRRRDTPANSSGTDADWQTVDCKSGGLSVHITGTDVGGTSADDDGTVPDGGTGKTEVIGLTYAWNSDSGVADWTRFAHQPLDFDTGGGTEILSVFGIALPGSGGPVIGGTSTNPLNVVFPSAQAVTQSGAWNLTNISGTVSLPTGAATETTLASVLTSLQLVDNLPLAQGSTTSGQSGALIMGAVTTGAPSYTTAQTSPLSLTTGGLLRVAIEAGGGSGGTSSSFSSSFPATGTAIGGSDGTNMQGPRVFDLDSGGGTQYGFGVSLRKVASGGSVELGTSSDPIRVDPTGTTTQPVSLASQPLPTGAATETTLASILSSLQTIDNIVSGSGVNISQFNGVTPLMGAGNTGTGSPRTTEASDSQLSAGVGATGDAAATAGSTGSLTAKARLMTSQLDTMSTSLASILTAVQLIDDDQTGATPCYITSAASTNATNCKASAGRVISGRFVNTTSTIYYLRLYNLASAPTCSSATGFVETIPVPHSTAAGGGITFNQAPTGQAFATGIGFCLTGGGSSTDNTNAATGVYVTLNYK